MAAGDDMAPEVRGPARRAGLRPGRGAGGRWLVWLLRGVIWMVLLVVGYRGVAAIVSGPAPVSPAPLASPVPAGAVHGFPVPLAEAYALQFAAVYLNFSPGTAAQRERALAAFVPAGSAPQLGWNGAGSQQLQAEQVASATVQNSHRAVITLLATVDGRLLDLGVPIYAAGGGLVVSGEPALLPPPARVTPPQPPGPASDSAAQAALSSQLPAFFQAYASGDNVTLGRFLAPGAEVTGLGGLVRFGSIAQVTAPPGGSTRHITVVVVWRMAGQAAGSSRAGTAGVSAAPAALETTYEMTVVSQAGSWYVRAIGASAQPPGPP